MSNSNSKKSNLIGIGTVLLIFVVWFAISNYTNINAIFLPTPQKVWDAFINICSRGYKGSSLMLHLTASLGRLLAAFVLSVVTAVPLGLLSGTVENVKAMLDPMINFYRPLPPLAYYTLLVLWMGIGDSSKICLLYLACFAPLYISSVSAVAKIESNYINNAIILGANKWHVFTTVIFPFSLPDIFAGMRTALGVGYTTVVAAEMVAARSGIGWMVLDASNYLRSDVIFVGIIIMGVTGIILDKIILLIEKLVIPWKGKNL